MKIVFTNGCFDLLTAAHCQFLQASRKLGDRLIVGLNTDESIRQIKGESRPIVPYEQREAVLLALRCVDDVWPLEETEPSKLIRQLRPYVVTKAKGYSPGNMPEWSVIEDIVAQCVFLDVFEGLSTSEIIAKCRG